MRYEYKTLTIMPAGGSVGVPNEDLVEDPLRVGELNELGQEGWELVSVVCSADGVMVAYLKRWTGKSHTKNVLPNV